MTMLHSYSMLKFNLLPFSEGSIYPSDPVSFTLIFFHSPRMNLTSALS